MKNFMKIATLIDLILMGVILITLPVIFACWCSVTSQTNWYLPVLVLLLFSVPVYILIILLISKRVNIQITSVETERKDGTN